MPSLSLGDHAGVGAIFIRYTIRNRLGRLDLLFNNAGPNAPAVALEELTDERWLTVVNVNLNVAFFCAREAVRPMKQQQPRGGRIINNGSISAHTAPIGKPGYRILLPPSIFHRKQF
ncbi:MAG: SDR family NAD(P)-dependent oxidoreductase [Acidobacteriaceae bacterium]